MDQEMQKKQDALLEHARKGVLKFVVNKGGRSNLSEMHDFSLNTYFIQHQSFSRLMESIVEKGFLTYDFETQEAEITETGRQIGQS